MQSETTYSGILGELQRFQASMEAKIGEIPHLEPSRAHFGQILSRAQDLVRQQAAVTAEKQTLTQQLKAALVDGQRLATLLRKGLQQHYGIRSERLTEFGLQPFRGRKVKSKTKPETPTPAPKPEPVPTAG
ncbi:MAG TPA: hypothetical protein VKK31_15570 [Thermoanaerobaculia bacterium]|nr:hypothetical protein [Thermoanaerobaculia bacterium]